jgi:hypothetical protein
MVEDTTRIMEYVFKPQYPAVPITVLKKVLEAGAQLSFREHPGVPIAVGGRIE